MGYSVFISGDQSFNQRIATEAEQNQIKQLKFCPSLVEGFATISKPDLLIKAIYIDSSDASFSLLKFIEHCAVLRAATPIFIIDSELKIETDEGKAFLKRNHIRGCFNRTTPLTKMLSAVKGEKPAPFAGLERSQGSKSDNGHIGIPVIDFIHETHYPFDLFIETKQNGFNLFATAGSKIDLDYLYQAAKTTLWLYVNEEVITRKRAAIRNTGLQIMDEGPMSPLWRTAEVLYSMKQMLNEFRKEKASDQLIDQTVRMLNDFFQVVSIISADESNKTLTYFIEQSKRSDKTIAVVALSMLMCRKMEFERNSAIEILGLAGLLQDLSLYQSHLQNIKSSELSKLSSEDQSFYRQHPLLTANILAQNTAVPEVVLQVIRQQHECKDRSGFPNRIGGSQLHPMSEILSLINAYLEETDGSPTMVDAKTYNSLERNVFPRYSEAFVTSFKQILEGLTRVETNQYSRDIGS